MLLWVLFTAGWASWTRGLVTPLALDERLLRLPKLLSVQGVDNAIAYGTLGQALAQLFAFFLGNACLHAVGAPRVGRL